MSDTERWARVRAIVEEAFEHPEEARATLLDARCGADALLRAEVESLLLADEQQPEGFLEGAEGARAAAALVAASAPGKAGGSPVSASGPLDPSEWVGRQLGGYRITRLLGEGGMGLVFEAVQESPRRLVALKVVRGGLFVDDATVRLFQREVEALARLQHAAIASIYESGRTADGQHYFAMELVSGAPLDQYLAATRLADPRGERRRRLSLFLEVAEGIAYAHQRGVIHRDIKPSNVFVREDGRVKVLDFGLARITDGDVALHTVATRAGSVQGTLPYMSPEQAQGDPAAIDTRSDVYSLGVLLFEMLTGELPVDLRGKTLSDALRAIQETPPRRPSVLDRSIDRDLETILFKALEKDPRKRYATVSALAEDVVRSLADLPILARPVGTIEQLQRLARRHRTAAAFSVVTVLTLIAGIVGTTTGMLRARAAEKEAREEAETARAVSAFLEDLFVVSDPGEARGNSITARELLDKAVAEVDSALVAEPRVRGRLLGVLGQVHRNLGLYQQARPLLERSLEIRAANPEENPIELARSHFSLAGLLRRLGEFDAARRHYEASLAIRERVLHPAHEEIAASLQGLANLYYDEGRYAEALPLSERGLAIVRHTLGEDHFDYPSFLSGYGFMLYGSGDLERARAVFEEVIARREKALGADHPNLGYDHQVLAVIMKDLGRHDEALAAARRGLANAERSLGPDHATYAEALTTVGELELLLGDARAAESAHRRAIEIFEASLGPDHFLTGMALDLLADALRAQGRVEEALAQSARAGVILETAFPPAHEARVTHEEIAARIVATRAAPKRP